MKKKRNIWSIKKILILISIIAFVSIVALYKNINKKNNQSVIQKSSSNTNNCVKTGCSSQLCVEKSNDGSVTNCEWKEVYKCYKLANCERQEYSGECGFTSNPEFEKCLLETE